MTTRRIAVLLGAALVSGCASGPDYRRPEVDLPGSYPGQAESSAPAIDARWWQLYRDETLNGLVAGALERNTDLRLAVARIEETDANLREAGAAFLPEIALGASGTRQRISTQTATPLPSGIAPLRNNVRLSASTAFEVDFWGKLRRAVEAARAIALASRYARDVVSLSLAGLTSQAYFSLRSLEAQIALTRATLASRDEFLELVRRRASGGIASALEVHQAEVARADAAVLLKDLERQRTLAGHQLGTLTGRLDLALAPSGALLALPVPPTPPAGLPSALIERRPDIRQAEQQLISANAQIGVAKAAMLPSISLTGLYGGESKSLSTLLQSGARIWSLGFGLSLPIFDWGRLEARTDAAEARARQTLALYQKSIESAFREVADALTNLEQSTAVEQDLQKRVEAARDALRLARIRYEAGYSSYLEVLDAQRNANDSELAVIRNRQNRLSASVDLMKALGGGWSADTYSSLPVGALQSD
ncbi:MAG: efflux transporter outer membrane subunit [Betaproteobacteria bacterium]|nr:efflux transporter outer membrane subunit [Betaproteobacteria bacterium]MBI2959036.1 efflux transporter outer membrane subunit [Betaproteobacteria bacterium]